MTKDSKKRVCVVGGGISGLVTAKVLQGDDFDVVIYEKESTLGGVWAPSRTYPGLRTNDPREAYAFSDFPYPEDVDDFPSAPQVWSYLNAYVDHFNLRDRIHLSSEVVSVSRSRAGTGTKKPFRVTVRPTGDSKTLQTDHFDFVVVCNGVFSQPHVPQIPGQDRFKGQVLHSSQIADSRALDGKRVIVVGAGKSALDCATLAARVGKSCTVVFRKPHWMVPRYFFGKIRVDKVLLTRFSEFSLLRYHHLNRLEAFLQGPAAPLVRFIWRMQSRLIARLNGMPPEMIPEDPLPAGIENVGAAGEIYRLVREGRIQPRRAHVSAFTGDSTIQLDTGERLEADVVVFATGWNQSVPFLDPDLQEVVCKDGAFHLYWHILPPDEQRLGFVGYASSIASQFASEMAAHWISQVFRGEMALPDRDGMEREIERVRNWIAEVYPARKEAYFIGAFLAHYIDDLVRDMGLKTKRTRNPLKEIFAPFWPERYKDVAVERRQRRSRSLT
jgi:dimethylaniline monooxygenase (N-oxide forming)